MTREQEVNMNIRVIKAELVGAVISGSVAMYYFYQTRNFILAGLIVIITSITIAICVMGVKAALREFFSKECWKEVINGYIHPKPLFRRRKGK